jgi:hypothetical protein
MSTENDAERRIHHLEEQLRQLEARAGWRGMDTAPKDTVLVLLLVVEGQTILTMAMWEDDPPKPGWHWHGQSGYFHKPVHARAWHEIPPAPPARHN